MANAHKEFVEKDAGKKAMDTVNKFEQLQYNEEQLRNQ